MVNIDAQLSYEDIVRGNNGDYWIVDGVSEYGPYDTKVEAKAAVDRKRSRAKNNSSDMSSGGDGFLSGVL